MVRCDDFYRKWQQAGNFCEKHPDTAARIDRFLDEIIPLLRDEVAKSEILNQENTPIGGILTENASRPLVRVESPDTRQKVVEQIVKTSEEKMMGGQHPQVTEREVSQIIAKVKGEPGKEGMSEPARPPIHLAKEPRPNPVEAVQNWLDDLEAKQDMPAIPRYMTDLLDLKSIKSMSEYLPCPCCGKPGILVWKCCGSTIDDAISSAQQVADRKIEKANAEFRARREAAQ